MAKKSDAKKGDADVLRLVVVFLREHAGLTQVQLDEATGIDQGDVSRYESGEEAIPEKSLRRIAKAVKVPWVLVVLLRRFVEAFLVAARRRTAPAGEPLAGEALEPVVLAVASYMLEEEAQRPPKPTPEEERWEAEEIWTALQQFPRPRRQHLLELAIELSTRASRNPALAVRLCEASTEAADRDAGEALELADLGLAIAGRVEGPESWRSRIQGYCWAFVANARREAGDRDGAGEAIAHARELWQAGVDSGGGLLPEGRWLDLEARMRVEE